MRTCLLRLMTLVLMSNCFERHGVMTKRHVLGAHFFHCPLFGREKNDTIQIYISLEKEKEGEEK